MSKVGAVFVSLTLDVAQPTKVQPASAQADEGEAVGNGMLDPAPPDNVVVLHVPLPGLKVMVYCVLLFMVYVAVATVLLVMPDFTAKALIVVVEETEMGDE